MANITMLWLLNAMLYVIRYALLWGLTTAPEMLPLILRLRFQIQLIKREY